MVEAPRHAVHGGASFGAIGVGFGDLARRHRVVDADVLDAWYEPAPAVLTTLREHLAWLVKTSPPTHGEGLRAAIAARAGVAESHILVGGGTSSLMFAALPRLVSRGDPVCILDPMYGEYAHVLQHLIGAELRRCELPFERGFAPDPARIAAAAAGCRLLVLVDPNSPTGAVLGRDGVRELLARLPAGIRVWIDETYIDFVPGVPTSEALLGDPRLLVAKSLSKFYALSGLRVGYLAGEAALIGELSRWLPPWSAGLLAQVAALRALESPDYYRQQAERTAALRAQLAAALAPSAGITVFPSVTNFLLFHTAALPAAELVQRCRAHDVWLRDCDSLSPRFAGRFVRTAVKDEAANARIAAAVADALSGR